ncbi:SIR2 family protein [Photobacterium sp. GB-210]|uniref:SIR2 family protein n=1 Tax=Photobacterium sp. GB-210 TaxID=2022104 RepID=UPI000D15361F|nr:SIR2 family protein [Photobacterium sp. GB-210]PSV38593.1 SIR2 family protein [Photobacterium sp. GB-210]
MSEFDFFAQAQKYYQKSPVIILGSGASAAFGLSGMGELSKHLVSTVETSGLDGAELEAWERFKALLESGTDLESALHEIRLSETLTDAVVSATWNLLNPQDLEVFKSSLLGTNEFPLAKLIKGLFRSVADQIDIVTTNYDRLAEYAAEQAGVHHYTGFTHGYRRLQTPPRLLRADRVVNILKVHGSLDWFTSPIGDVIGLNQVETIPEGHKPQIVTPGIAKYMTTYHEPFRTIIQMADSAIRNSDSYLCVGFGFNDEHIQEKLVEKCIRGGGYITLVTWGLSDTARDFLLSGRAHNFLAIERGEHDNQSIIYSSETDGPIIVNCDFWSLSGYLELVL